MSIFQLHKVPVYYFFVLTPKLWITKQSEILLLLLFLKLKLTFASKITCKGWIFSTISHTLKMACILYYNVEQFTLVRLHLCIKLLSHSAMVQPIFIHIFSFKFPEPTNFPLYINYHWSWKELCQEFSLQISPSSVWTWISGVEEPLLSFYI